MSLVKNVKETGTARRHQLQPMNYDRRKFVHELAEFYGCQTQSYDQEPVRAVVLIGKPDVVGAPSTPLYQIIAAERPAKQTAKCPSLNRAAGLGGPVMSVAEREKFSWPVEMPSVGGAVGNFSVPSRNRTTNSSKSVPTVDYFEVTD